MEIDKFFLAVGTNTALGDSHRPRPVRPKTIAQCNRPRPVRSKPSPSVIALAQLKPAYAQSRFLFYPQIHVLIRPRNNARLRGVPTPRPARFFISLLGTSKHIYWAPRIA